MSTSPRRLGRYELRERLGRGGMAEVWKALDTQLQRYVAIKLLHADLQADPDFITRFEREARVVASLYHPNIVQVHDFQVLHPPESEGTIAYMVMDYVEGPTLSDYIHSTSSQGNFPPAEEIVYLFALIGSAIDYAHQHGMVHRDIKPANILLDRTSGEASGAQNAIGEPILTDFGIAKLMGTSTGSISGSSAWLGTPLYISPEQVQGYAGNERSDIYSLGVILYEMCTGVLPFHGDNPSTVMMQHLKEPPPDPRLMNPHISAALSLVILRCLAKNPAERFSSASSLAAALAESFNLPVPEELDPPAYPRDVLNTPTHLQPATSYATLLMQPSVPLPMPMEASSPTPVQKTGVTPVMASTTKGQPSPLQLPQTPPPTLPAQPGRRRRRLFGVLIALLLLVLVAGGLGGFLLYERVFVPARPPGGYAFFVSSGQWNQENNQGIEDKFQINLHNVPDPAAGKRYYAWLLGDKAVNKVSTNGGLCTQTPIPTRALFLGALTVHDGSVAFTYAGTQSTNLLAIYSRLLITQEDASKTPGSPSANRQDRLYYAELPQAIDKVGKCFSALDDMRHLLSEGVQIQGLGLYGGVDVQLLRNVLKVLEWAYSARESWPQQPDFIRRQLVRVLDYVDGEKYVSADVPTGTPLLIDPLLVTIGLATVIPNQDTTSYLSRVAGQLKNIILAPGVTKQMSNQAAQIEEMLNNVQNWLMQVRQDAKLLVAMTNAQLSQPSTLALMDELTAQANYAFDGRLDPATNGVQAGTMQIHYGIQQLTTLTIQPYSAS